MDTPRRIFQVSIRTLLEITAAIAVILAIVFARGCNDVGRYHYTMGPGGVILYDSVTGKFWQRNSSGGEWIPQNTPKDLGR